MPQDAGGGGSAGPDRPVRVAVVDDSDDVRLLMTLLFRRDPRFDVVGEAGNGRDAIDLAERTRPDLMILDRQMPVLGGVEAIPEIRRRSPRTEVVLYTAVADSGTAQAALTAGALDVLEKTTVPRALADELVRILVRHWAHPDAEVEILIGPVPSSAATAWIANTTQILAAVADHPGVLSEPVPVDVIELFQRFLGDWAAVAAAGPEFYWAARAGPADVRRLVEHWALLDSMSDDQLAALGCHWSGPEAQPFFAALTAGVLTALAVHAETQQLGQRLAQKWGGGE